MDSRMMRWNGMAAVPEDLPTIEDSDTNDIQETVNGREVVTTNPFIETKDKETAETNDNDIEKMEKVEVSSATEILEMKADVETEVSTAIEIIEEKEDKEAVRETETKDKEAAENNDNYAEKVEKDEIIGGFSTSGVSTDETPNIFDPDIRDKGGGRGTGLKRTNCKVTEFKCKI